jgi:hypothetical protein
MTTFNFSFQKNPSGSLFSDSPTQTLATTPTQSMSFVMEPLGLNQDGTSARPTALVEFHYRYATEPAGTWHKATLWPNDSTQEFSPTLLLGMTFFVRGYVQSASQSFTIRLEME